MKTVEYARSDRDGIIFYSTIENYWGVKSYIDESGNINTKFIPIQIYDFFENEYFSEDNEKINILAIILFNTIIICFSLFFLRNIKFSIVALLFSNISIEFFSLVEQSWKYKIGNQKSIARFHSAEHMVINAYDALQRIPNLEEIKKFSRFSYSCGSTLMFSKIVYYLLLSICVIFLSESHLILFLLSLFGVIITTKAGTKIGFFIFLQALVTSKPTDTELLVAIKGLEQFERMERLLKTKDMNLICKYIGKSISNDF